MGKEYRLNGNIAKITVANTVEATELIINNPVLFRDYEITKAKMDDVFLAATGKALLSDDYSKKERKVR